MQDRKREIELIVRETLDDAKPCQLLDNRSHQFKFISGPEKDEFIYSISPKGKHEIHFVDPQKNGYRLECSERSKDLVVYAITDLIFKIEKMKVIAAMRQKQHNLIPKLKYKSSL